MSDIVKIIYNNQDAFYPQPTPLIGLDYQNIYFGELWGKSEVFNIQGQLTGCTYNDIVQAQSTLLNRFNKNFQTLQIWEQTGNISGLVYEKKLCEIKSVNFPTDNWVGVLPYSITISCYPSGLFSGMYGILDPEDSWSFSEERSEILTANHVISCKGFNTSETSSNALNNARTWAFGRTGLNSIISPIFISGVGIENFCLVSQVESIDRFNGTYALTETYTNDLARSGYGVVRYSTNIESGNNIITVSLNGTAQGCNGNITGLRYAFNRLNKAAIAANAYQSTFGLTNLNPVPVSQSFTEDPFLTKIDFSYIYNNDNSPNITFDYTVDLSTQINGFIQASINGVIKVRNGDLASKLSQALSYADTVNLYNLVLQYYNNFDQSSIVPLNPIPITNGKSVNQSDGTVQLNATYNNETKISNTFDIFDYTINIRSSVQQVDSKPKLDGLGNYSVVDLGFANRASLTVDGNAVINKSFSADAGITEIKNKCLSLLGQYGRFTNAVLEKDEIITNRMDNRIVSFSIGWSFDSPNIIGPSSIGSLSV